MRDCLPLSSSQKADETLAGARLHWAGCIKVNGIEAAEKTPGQDPEPGYLTDADSKPFSHAVQCRVVS